MLFVQVTHKKMITFQDINGHLVYAKVKSKNEAIKLRDEAKETAQGGKNVVIFFDNNYHSYLAPGNDPYIIRKEIENFLNPPPEETIVSKQNKKSVSKNTTTRNSSSRLVSKKETSSTSSPVKKKLLGFF